MDDCASCKHWQQVWNDPASKAYVHGNAAEKIPADKRTEWGVCEAIGMPEMAETVTTLAFTQDGSEYMADLHTRSDFGCVLWAG